MSSSAPKFASFRPKPKEVLEQPPPEKPRRAEKEHSKQSQTSSREKVREERRTSPSRENRNHAGDDASKRAYFSDRRGDLDIVKFGTLNRYDIPGYRRTGHGNILGLPGQKIDRDYSTDKKIYVIPLVRPRQKRLLTDKHAISESKRTLQLAKVAEDSHHDATRDFIALSSTGKRKRDSGSGSEEEAEDARAVDYRGIVEKKPSLDIMHEADTYYESDTDAAMANSEVTQKNSRLIRETRDDPGNLQAWLDLIEHQEPMMLLGRAVSEVSAADRHHLADVRISTYEEALRKIGNDESSQIELHAGLLREAQRHWDDAKVNNRWQTVLDKYPQSVRLWYGYLDFRQSTFSSFRYEECRTVFLRALKALQSVHTENKSLTSEPRLHLFLRLTMLIQQAGYQELALAIWQAVLEFRLLAPDDLVADKTQHFEVFWESEAPRIGEPDCKGWRHTTIEHVVPPDCAITLDTSGSSRSSLASFRRCELEYTSKLRYPGRSADDVGEDDPFHTIFFSDLCEYLVSFPEVSPELQIDAFLCFCGLPTLVTQNSGGTWRNDPYLQSGTSYREAAIKANAETPQYEEALFRYSQAPITKLQMTGDLLIQQTFSLHSSRLSPDFVRIALKLLATNAPDSEFVGEYLLAFESKHFPSDVPNSAKRLLKDRPSSVRLYNMYGIAEGQRGNSAKADQIFSAALNIKAGPVHRLSLLGSYVWQALHGNNKIEALRRLVRYQGRLLPTQLSRPDSDAIEATRTAFQASLQDALLSQNFASAVLNANHLAQLAYLSSDCNISAALEVHTNLIAWFASHKMSLSMYAEMHAQAIARLLTYHVTHTSIVKPALLRTALEPLIANFPDNTVLLSTYAANEARFSIEDRVRGNMHRVLTTLPASSLATWTFAIHHETLKSEVAGSTSHSIRAMYKRATTLDAPGAHCSVTWQTYIHFELGEWRKEQSLRPNRRPHRDGKKSKWEMRVEEAGDRVRQTIYLGLKMLPWCKDFIMLAFTHAKDVFSEEELWRLYKVMMEKELRVYTEMDEPGI